MQTPIHTVIGYTEKQYENLTFELMFTWSELYSGGCFRKQQSLLANRQINQWFLKELTKLIKVFREDLEPFKNIKTVTCKERCHLYTTVVTRIYEIYPSALMTEVKSIRTKKTESNPYLN